VQPTVPPLSPTEALILQLIIRAGTEAYGLDLVKRSGGKLKRGTVYVTLQRMEEKGFVTSRVETTAERVGVGSRRLYGATGLGQQAIAAREMVGQYLANNAAEHKDPRKSDCG
jgi:PadR family transcriptional regulator, regulatory protein PadR